MIGYVDVEKADQIVSQNFIAADPVRTYWNELTEEDKEVCLRQALTILDSLPYVGRRTDSDQLLEFPRWPDIDVPESVTVSQVLIGVRFADPNLSSEMERYRRLRTAGVSSYRIGKFAESIREAKSTGYGLAYLDNNVVTLLRPWLEGSFRIV